jgi:phosphinothricin acetyltransferase
VTPTTRDQPAVLVRPARAGDVDPAWRRCGTGARMLADLLTWGGRAAVSSVVNARNAPSLALHAAHGFREVRRAPTFARIGFDGGTGVLLRRDGREDQA